MSCATSVESFKTNITPVPRNSPGPSPGRPYQEELAVSVETQDSPRENIWDVYGTVERIDYRRVRVPDVQGVGLGQQDGEV